MALPEFCKLIESLRVEWNNLIKFDAAQLNPQSWLKIVKSFFLLKFKRDFGFHRSVLILFYIRINLSNEIVYSFFVNPYSFP